MLKKTPHLKIFSSVRSVHSFICTRPFDMKSTFFPFFQTGATHTVLTTEVIVMFPRFNLNTEFRVLASRVCVCSLDLIYSQGVQVVAGFFNKRRKDVFSGGKGRTNRPKGRGYFPLPQERAQKKTARALHKIKKAAHIKTMYSMEQD